MKLLARLWPEERIALAFFGGLVGHLNPQSEAHKSAAAAADGSLAASEPLS